MNSLDKPEDFEKDMRTISSILTIDEKSRMYLWNMCTEYTFLINRIFQEVSQNSQFPEWLNRGNLPNKAVQTICNNLKQSEFVGLPSRVYTSAILLVSHTFKGWFALHRNIKLKLEGKRQWLGVMETDIELAQNTDIRLELIQARATEILTEIETQRNSSGSQQESQDNPKKHKTPASQSSNSLMSFLFQRWNSAEAILDRRAIAHLLRNSCQVNWEEEEPDAYALRLDKKRAEIQRLEDRLKSRLPSGRDPRDEKSQQFLQEAIAFAEHCAYIPSCFWLKWHRTILNKQPINVEDLNHWFLGLAYYRWSTAAEFAAWEQDLPRRTANLQTNLSNLPYPLLFGSSTDLYWLCETNTPSIASSNISPPSKAQSADGSVQSRHKTKRRRVRKRQKSSEGRICVSFRSKGLSDLLFKVQCDRRQLPIFKQFVTDFQDYKTRSEEHSFSSGLFTLRSASLIWKEDKQALSQKGQSKNEHSQAPWNKHRLHLHCTIDNHSLHAEGIEKVLQKKRSDNEKKLEGLKKKKRLLEQAVLEQELDADKQQIFHQYLVTQKALKHEQSDFERFKKQLPLIKEVQPKKVVDKCRKLDDLHNHEKILKQQLANKEINAEQQELLRQKIENQKAIKRTQSTLDRLNNSPPARNRELVYLKQSHIVASVCFSLSKVIGVAVIDTGLFHSI